MDIREVLVFMIMLALILSPATSFRSESSGTMYVTGDQFLDTDGSDLMKGALNMNNNSIVNLSSPINGQDAATKNYVDKNDANGTDNQTLDVINGSDGANDLISISNGNSLTVEDSFEADTNASTACSPGEYFDGNGNCKEEYDSSDDGDTSSNNELQNLSEVLNRGNIVATDIDVAGYSLLNPSLVDGVNLDSTGNALAIDSKNRYSVASDSLADNEILNNSLTSSSISSGSIGSEELASNSITSSGGELDSSVVGNQLGLSSGSLKVLEGSGSGLNADRLDSVELTNISWNHISMSQTDINVSDLGVANSNLNMNSHNITNVESINNEPKIERPKVNKGVNKSGTGIKHVRSAKNISASTTENVNISWHGKFLSPSYTVNCNVEGTNAELDDITIRGIADRFKTSVEVRIENTLVSDREVLLHCVAFHD